MSNKIPYKQDLPPKGGYPQLQIARIKTWTPKRNNKHIFCEKY